VKLVVVKPLQVPVEDNIVRRSIRHSVAFIDRGVGAASPASSDIPFARNLAADPQNLSPAARLAENIPTTKALGETRGLEPRSVADFARTVR
jgi:hypothetical protein